MSYVEWLRSHIGNEPILLVYATAIVRDSGSRILFQRRGDFPIWGLPGGILEPGEKIRETLIREVYEETGFEVTSERFVGLYSSTDYTIHYPNGDVVQQVTVCFDCRIVGGEGRPDGTESLEQEFRTAEEAPDLFTWYEQMLRDAAVPGATRFDAGTARIDNPRPEGIVRWLRSHVGHEPLVVPCAASIVHDDRGRLLMVRRADSGLWALPAGIMELGERIDQTAIRETEEETGLTVRPTRLTGFYTGKDQLADYPNGDRAWLALACFAREIESGRISADGTETLDVAFFDLDALPLDHLPWGPRTRRRLADARGCRSEATAD
jgi:8-oxo-dGTP pyrophosphatase MutT (NUDIX family)